jgi:hypothetical protein
MAPFLSVTSAPFTPANMVPSMELSMSGMQTDEPAPENNVPSDNYNVDAAKKICYQQVVKKMFVESNDDVDVIIRDASGPGKFAQVIHESPCLQPLYRYLHYSCPQEGIERRDVQTSWQSRIIHR